MAARPRRAGARPLAKRDVDFLDHEYDRLINSRVGDLVFEDLSAEMAKQEMGPDAVSVRAVLNPTTGQARYFSVDKAGELDAVQRAVTEPLRATGHRVEPPTREELERARPKLLPPAPEDDTEASASVAIECGVDLSTAVRVEEDQ
jgi:hypothetical protein